MYQSKRVTKVLLSIRYTVPGALGSLLAIVVLSANPLRKYSEPSGNMQIRPKGGYYSYSLSRFTGPPGLLSPHRTILPNPGKTTVLHVLPLVAALENGERIVAKWTKIGLDQKALSKSYIPPWGFNRSSRRKRGMASNPLHSWFFCWKCKGKTWYSILGLDAMPFSLKNLLLNS